MPAFDFLLREQFLNKPECVVNFPEWLLPSQEIQKYRAMSGLLAVVEIAGRDSIAAAIKSVKKKGFTDLLPTYVYTGTEHGHWSAVEEAVNRLSRCLPNVRVHNLIVLGSPGFWQALNGRFISELISRYGFYTPCLGCHIYLHSVRIPLAIIMGNAPIISGERERHDDAVKINQISEALNFYQNLADNFGVRLLLPLRNVAEGKYIEDILEFAWKQGKEQMGCVLSGNYRRLDSSINITAHQVQRYLEEFAWPCTTKIIESYVANRIPKHLEIAARILGC
ncbi:MAG: hypothetical protein HF982_06020 [Desulfobacteraceae bacterium]|nr:hypothetical protein [Desulfobacteraceae bacterium]MBC2719133.1 hypothetical protein [Desulfobacteraceae bacterium]